MRERGLTLIEVLVAMWIAVVAGSLLVVIMVNSAGFFTNQSSKMQQGLNINDSLLQVRNSIKQASAVAVSYTSGPTTYTTGSNLLVLKVLSIDSLNNLIDDTYDYFVFFRDQNLLRFKTFPNPASSRKSSDRIFSTIVDSINFQYFNSAIPPVEVAPASATNVRVSLSLRQKNGLKYEIKTGTSEANLRND